jgi:hypothetical protein
MNRVNRHHALGNRSSWTSVARLPAGVSMSRQATRFRGFREASLGAMFLSGNPEPVEPLQLPPRDVFNAHCVPENFGESSFVHQLASFGGVEPTRLALALLRPFIELPIDPQ